MQLNKSIKAYTDYPVKQLGDIEGKIAPIRECQIISYDENKYCKVIIHDIHTEIKSGYLYKERGRYGEVESLSQYLCKLEVECQMQEIDNAIK